MTIEEIKAKLSAWRDAETAAISGKSYTIDGVSVTRQDLSTIREQVSYWSKMLRAHIQANPYSINIRQATCIDRGGNGWRR